MTKPNFDDIVTPASPLHSKHDPDYPVHGSASFTHKGFVVTTNGGLTPEEASVLKDYLSFLRCTCKRQ